MFQQLSPLLLAPTLTLAQLPFSNNSQPNLSQKLTMYAKPAVVRVEAKCSGTYRYEDKDYSLNTVNRGTGFLIDPSGYIATNFHIVDCKDNLLQKLVKELEAEKSDAPSRAKVKREAELKESSSNLKVYLPNVEEGALPSEIKARGTPFDEKNGKDVAIIKIEVENAPVLKLGNSESVELLDPIFVLGYPSAADVVYGKGSGAEASVTEGKVSNPNKTLASGVPVLQADVQIGAGSSGSPVINERGEVIGMITFTGSGASDRDRLQVPFAMRTSTIREFMRQAGAVNNQAVTDRLYRQGLEFFWKGDARGAKAKFEAVKQLFPQHSEVERLIGESEQQIAENWDNTDYRLWLAILGGVVVLLAGAYWLRRKPTSQRVLAVETMGATVETPAVPPAAPAPPSSLPAETVASVQPYVELRNQQGQELRLYLQQNRHRIGRDRDWSDIDIPDSGWEVISRHHATIGKEGNDYRIYDGDGTTPSTNGVFLNGTRIDPNKGHLLKEGEKLQIGGEPHNQVTLIYYNPASSS